jgi:glutathione S-transferase
MAIDFYWGSGSPYCWRVQLALEHKRLAYNSHLLKFDSQEHKAPQMLLMNPRGKLPVLKDGDYVVFESVAILHFLDRKYPSPPIFGVTPEETGVITRVISEYQTYAEPSLMKFVGAVLSRRSAQAGAPLDESVADALYCVGGEARTIERRLTMGDWVVGDQFSAVDMVIYPDIRLLLHALEQPAARDLAARFLPLDINYPALGHWLDRVAALPGHNRTWPPGWGPPPRA